MRDNVNLNSIANEIRFSVIENAQKTKTPHLGSCLSCIDILTALYFKHLKTDPENVSSSQRDRFVLSKGHAAPALFFVLAKAGFFSAASLDDYGKNGSAFHEHPPAPGFVPGVEAATGSLGHGLSISAGYAYANKLNNIKNNNIALLSDGECNEGAVWEAAMFASASNLNNLTAIIDFNKWQATGRSQEILLQGSLSAKWSAFNWNVIEIDGHDFSEINNALECSALPRSRPLAIIAHTIKGKGVSFMEDDNNWHYRTPNEEEVNFARQELGI